MKNRIKKWLRALAGLLAGLVLLDLFCAWYYNPAGYLRDESRATDVIRAPGRFTSRANEGFSWAVIDDNGCNNAHVPGEDGVFVLMMGSSHTEGLYVPPGKDVSSRLQMALAERGVGGTVYNIGVSQHQLARNIFNLDRALTRFESRSGARASTGMPPASCTARCRYSGWAPSAACWASRCLSASA